MTPERPQKFKVKGRRSRSPRDVKICQIVNNAAGGCSISIKFSTDYNHVPPDLLQTFKVNGSKVKVIAWHDVLAWENRHISWTDSLTEFKLCANYPTAQRSTWYVFKVKRSNIQIPITPPRIARFRSNFAQSSTVVKPVYYMCSTSKVKGQGHEVRVQGHSVT